jgi:hypothetical protein
LQLIYPIIAWYPLCQVRNTVIVLDLTRGPRRHPLKLENSMRISTLALAGLFGGLLLAGDASACHKKKCACPAPAPVAVCAPAPVVACAPAPKAKHHMKMPKMTMHHKKTATVCATYAPTYSAPVSYPTPQSVPTPQATGQGM